MNNGVEYPPVVPSEKPPNPKRTLYRRSRMAPQWEVNRRVVEKGAVASKLVRVRWAVVSRLVVASRLVLRRAAQRPHLAHRAAWVGTASRSSAGQARSLHCAMALNFWARSRTTWLVTTAHRPAGSRPGPARWRPGRCRRSVGRHGGSWYRTGHHQAPVVQDRTPVLRPG